MKIYKTYWQDASEGFCQSWHPSMREADRALVARRREHKDRTGSKDDPEPMGVDVVNVPTDKQGLIGWLNTNFSRDNG